MINKINWNWKSIYWYGYWLSVIILVLSDGLGFGFGTEGKELVLSLFMALLFSFGWPLIALQYIANSL